MLEAAARDLARDAAPPSARTAASAPPMRLGARDRTHAGWALAPDEVVVWEGRPAVIGLAVRAFRLPVVAAYFGALSAWGLVEWTLGQVGFGAVAMPLASGIFTLAILLATALLLARTTTYLVTSDRIILRYGAAVSRSLSIPFRQVGALRLSVGRSGSGDIAFALKAGNRIPYLKLWPHVRPWQLRQPEPMLCAVPDAALTATRLARQLAAQPTNAAPGTVDRNM